MRVLDDFSSGKIANLKSVLPKIDLLKGDIRDEGTCLRAAAGMDYILHQAALRSVPKSMDQPREYNQVNINGTLNMLSAALKHKVKHFVFASSSSVYGEIIRFPEKETFLPQPISPYALSKLAGEHYCRIFSHHYGLNTTCLRYFNVFGPRQPLDDEYAVVVPKFISCLLKNLPPPIYGTGKQSRDFTFVQNVVRANILAAGRKTGKGEAINIASGKDYSVLEFVRILNKLLKKNIKAKFLPPRPGDVFKTLADLSQAKKILKYQPAIGFVEGLKITLENFGHA